MGVFGFLVAGVAVLLIVAGLFSYLALPALISYILAGKLRDEYDLEQRPEVDVAPDFPPALLFGRIGRIQARIDRMNHEGVETQNVRVDLESVKVSLSSILRRKVEPDIRSVSLSAEISQESLSRYIERKGVGARNGEVRIHGREVFYWSPNALFGFPANVELGLQVAGKRSVAVSFGDILVRGARLPSSLIGGALPTGGVTMDVGELPFEAALQSIEPLDGVLIVRAGR